MLIYKNHSPHLYMGGVLLAMIVAIGATKTQLQEDARKQTTQTARARVIDETEPLCRAALPRRDLLHFVAAPDVGYHKNFVKANLWTVECLDNHHVPLIHLLWDADSKRAIVFSPAYSQPAWKSRTAASVALSDTKAAVIAREWVCRLSPLSHANGQSVVTHLERNESTLRVRLRLSDGEAILWLNEWTGEILSALVQDKTVSPKQKTS